MTLKKAFAWTLCLCALGLAAALPAAAQGYPKGVVKWIVPFPPGGGVDLVARHPAHLGGLEPVSPARIEHDGREPRFRREPRFLRDDGLSFLRENLEAAAGIAGVIKVSAPWTRSVFSRAWARGIILTAAGARLPIRASIGWVTASGAGPPVAGENLRPLYSGGLWDAVMTMPASARRLRVT